MRREIVASSLVSQHFPPGVSIMPEIERRDFVASTAATLRGPRRIERASTRFMNNVPNPLLAEKGVADL
jgi:hypothetical protein